MSLLWQCGAELQSATALMEVDTVTGSPTISTSIKRSGAASFRFNASGSAVYMQHQYSTGIDAFLSMWVYFASFPGSTATIMRLWDGAAGQRIDITSSGQLQFIAGDGTTQLGSNTASLSLNTWYNIQIAGTDSPGLQEARLNGVVIGNSGTGFSGLYIRFGVQTAVTMDMYVDDIIVNNDLTGVQDTYPDIAARIVHAKPNAAGDSNTWKVVGGGTGSSNNYQQVDEITPDNATSYIVRNTAVSNQPKDLYNIEDCSTVGIDNDDKIICVAIGSRVGSTSASSAAGRNINVGIKSGGTESWSGSIDASINGFTNHSDPVPRVHKHVSYVDPSDSAAWTPSKINSLQIGARANSSATTDVRVTTLYASIQYVQSVSSKQYFKNQAVNRASTY